MLLPCQLPQCWHPTHFWQITACHRLARTVSPTLKSPTKPWHMYFSYEKNNVEIKMKASSNVKTNKNIPRVEPAFLSPTFSLNHKIFSPSLWFLSLHLISSLSLLCLSCISFFLFCQGKPEDKGLPCRIITIWHHVSYPASAKEIAIPLQKPKTMQM